MTPPISLLLLSYFLVSLVLNGKVTGSRVIGVEANSSLVDECTSRFQHEIADGRVVLLNLALSCKSADEPVLFYIHKVQRVLSQVVRPSDETLAEFDVVRVPQRRASDVVKDFGEPYYIKIDVEHFDHVVLADLFASGIRPPYISAESHSVDVFSQLVSAGYHSFNLVEGATITNAYENASIHTSDGTRKYSFLQHSAGPCTDDIASPWMDKESFFYFLASARLGWKDIHATLLSVPTVRYSTPVPEATLRIQEHLADFIPSIGRSLAYRLASRRRK